MALTRPKLTSTIKKASSSAQNVRMSSVLFLIGAFSSVGFGILAAVCFVCAPYSVLVYLNATYPGYLLFVTVVPRFAS